MLLQNPNQRLDTQFPWTKHKPLQSDLQLLMRVLETRMGLSEADIARIDDLQGTVIQEAEEQINILIKPAVDRIEAYATLGFLIAKSTVNFQPAPGSIQVFPVDVETRSLFMPTQFVTFTRAANYTDWAIGRVQDWNPDLGYLTIQFVYVSPNCPAATDWYVSATAAETPAVISALSNFVSAQTEVLSAVDQTESNRATVEADKMTVSADKLATQTALGSAQTAASNAQAFADQASSSADRAEAAQTALDPAAFATRVTALETDKAPLASPALTGNPTCPDQLQSENSTRIANTKYVRQGFTDVKGGVSSGGDTLKKLFDLIAAIPVGVTQAYVDAADSLKAPLLSPTFTGDPAAPTQSPGNNTTRVATTAFVTAAVAALNTALLGGVDASGDTLKELYDAIQLKMTSTAAAAALAGLTPATDRLPYFSGVNTAALATFSAFARTLLDDADAATMLATLGAQAAATAAKLNVENQILTGGVQVTSKDLGTITTGTVTPDPGDRPNQHYINNGAHTLAPSANYGSFLLDITNGSTPGAITRSGWTKYDGVSFDTTAGHKWRCHCSIGVVGSLLVVEAMF